MSLLSIGTDQSNICVSVILLTSSTYIGKKDDGNDDAMQNRHDPKTSATPQIHKRHVHSTNDGMSRCQSILMQRGDHTLRLRSITRTRFGEV